MKFVARKVPVPAPPCKGVQQRKCLLAGRRVDAKTKRKAFAFSLLSHTADNFEFQ